MGESRWTRHRSGAELYVYFMFFGFVGIIGRLMFHFPWWSLAVIGTMCTLLVIRSIVRSRRARERERALLRRFAE